LNRFFRKGAQKEVQNSVEPGWLVDPTVHSHDLSRKRSSHWFWISTSTLKP